MVVGANVVGEATGRTARAVALNETRGRTACAVALNGAKAGGRVVVAANVVGEADGPHGLRRCVKWRKGGRTGGGGGERRG